MSYRVVYEREAEADAKGRRWWLARVPAVKGCHTQGRTLDEARRRIREALGLFVERAEHAELVDDVRLPKAITHVLKRRVRRECGSRSGTAGGFNNDAQGRRPAQAGSCAEYA